ncbi:MAG: flagellar protein FlaG [bacterium]|nr:flagellar protein FlaG [bacterium]
MNQVTPTAGNVKAVAPAEPSSESTQSAARSAQPSSDPVPAQRETLRGLSVRVESAGRSAEFSYDESVNRVVVKIYSSANEPREIVRQIPAEEYLAFAARYREMLGVLFDEQV